MTIKRKITIGIGVLVLLLVAVGVVGFKLYRDKLVVQLPDYPPVKQAVWLEQNWTQEQREWFHHGDQGTQTLNIPYEWFVALEQPRLSLVGDVGRLSDSAYLDRYGFIPGATLGGENQLPIGFAKGNAMTWPDGKRWFNPQTKEQMLSIGLTCAACHTGRFTYRHTAVLIDGGPALTNLAKFSQGLGEAVLFTRLSSHPFFRSFSGRFERFARNVLGDGASEEAKAELRQQLDTVWKQLELILKLDQGVHDKSVEEGFGRLDALNRIGNQVFSVDLKTPGNYAPTTAPVNFPHIWNTSWFDWVQYNASIEQPMVRNAGEALGVSAPINLTDPERGLFGSNVQVKTLFEIEQLIAGKEWVQDKPYAGLASPKWPEEILGPINRDLAARGAALYDELCRGCHLPPVGSKEFWESKSWLPANEYNKRYLHVKPIEIKDIGTDEAQAVDMINRKVSTPPSLKITTNAFGPALGEVVEKAIYMWYDSQKPPTPAPARVEMNGYRPNGIQAPRAYKVRPLNGVWATPPFIHNGSVPNVYALLSPVSERPKTFYLGRREYDPVCMGYQLTALTMPEGNPDLRCLGDKANPDAGKFFGGFKLDTSIRGNRNTGHEFRDGARGNGVIGRALKPEERRALVEFLKTQ